MLIRELLQRALDALEQYKKYTRGVMIPSTHCTGNAAITALRKALAAPMPEPSDMVMVPREPTPEMIIEGSCAVKPGGFIEDIYAAMIAAAPAPVVPADQWKAAIDNELICCHIGTTDSFPNAKSALKNLIDWHVSVAIDPAVSSDAQALIDRGAAQPADLTETAHRIENGEITNGHFSHRNLVMCSKEHYAALIDSTLTAQPAVPLTDDHTNNVLAALLIARRYVLTNPEQLASIAYAINIVKTHGIGGGK